MRRVLVDGKPALERAAAILLTAVLLWLTAAGCGSETPRGAVEAGLSPAYTGLECPRGTVTLDLEGNGSFELRRVAPGGDAGHSVLESVRGSWVYHVEGELVLSSQDWEAVFAPDTTVVRFDNDDYVLPSLMWLRSTEPTFADSCELVSRPDLDAVLHPGGGRQASW
jgi:hypothetical protein